MSRACDICGDSLADYFPNCGRCDSCTDAHGLEPDPERTTVDNMRGDFLQAMSTICGGLSRDSWG